MLAKHGIGEGPVNVRTLDAALAGLSLEQTHRGEDATAARGRDCIKAANS